MGTIKKPASPRRHRCRGALAANKFLLACRMLSKFAFPRARWRLTETSQERTLSASYVSYNATHSRKCGKK
ncbi:Formate dehydrogenase -O, gamma subunit [Pseudomonas sp. OF001]|nr:Formate dehydrogenase -O, gamma subunit [Pseudomonas sp. OF001]